MTGNDEAVAAVVVLAGVAAAVVGIRFGLRRLARRYPTAADTLPLRDLTGFYTAALRFLWRNKWMIWVPYVLGLPTVLFQIRNYFRVRSEYAYMFEGAPTAGPIPWYPEPLEWHAKQLYHALGRLDNYPDTWFVTHIGAVAAFSCFLVFPLFLHHIGRRIDNDTHEGLRFMRRILRPAWFVFFSILAMSVAIWIACGYPDLFESPMPGLIALIITASIPSLGLCVCFLQCALLVTVRGRIAGEPWSLKAVYTRALDAIAPVFLWILILAAFAWPVQMHPYLRWRLLEWMGTPTHAMPIVTAVFFMLPFRMVSSPAPLRASLRGYLEFLARHGAKVILFTLGGAAFLFVTNTALNTEYLRSGTANFHRVPLMLAAYAIAPAFRIVFSTVFFTAAWMFFLKCEPTATLPAPPLAPGGSSGGIASS